MVVFCFRDGTYDDCQLSQHTYIGELKATYAASDLTKQSGYYATNIKPLRLLQGMMQAPGTPLKDSAGHERSGDIRPLVPSGQAPGAVSGDRGPTE